MRYWTLLFFIRISNEKAGLKSGLSATAINFSPNFSFPLMSQNRLA